MGIRRVRPTRTWWTRTRTKPKAGDVAEDVGGQAEASGFASAPAELEQAPPAQETESGSSSSGIESQQLRQLASGGVGYETVVLNDRGKGHRLEHHPGHRP